jgi:hypothetical protein
MRTNRRGAALFLAGQKRFDAAYHMAEMPWLGKECVAMGAAWQALRRREDDLEIGIASLDDFREPDAVIEPGIWISLNSRATAVPD